MHLLRLVPRESREQMLALLRRVAAGERLDGIESKRLLRDGCDLDGLPQPLADPQTAGGRVIGVAAVVRDISSRKRLEEQLRELALRDPLTGLYNRRHFEAELDRQLALARRTGQPGVVLMIDLDRFKEVNDTFGHEAGDDLLRGVAVGAGASGCARAICWRGSAATSSRRSSSTSTATTASRSPAASRNGSGACAAAATARSRTSASVGVARIRPRRVEDAASTSFSAADQPMYARKREKL